MIAYFDGRFLPAADAAIPLDDPGFLWGATITDRLRTYGGRLFRFADHAARFRESCRLACVTSPVDDATLESVSLRLVEANRGGGEVSVIWLATPARFIAHTVAIDVERELRLLRDGLRLRTVEASLGVDPRIKHRSRLAWWVAKHALGGDEPLFTDGGLVRETATSNVVFVRGGRLLTPPRALPGITLAVVRGSGLDIAEEDVPVTGVDEAFCTNSTFGVFPVSAIDGRALPVPGPVTRDVLKRWDGVVNG